MSLTLDQFLPEDLAGFMSLATVEGWLCDRWEFDFLLRDQAAGCFVIRHDQQACAYITAIAYGCAGWIGNLIVEPVYRQQGLGRWLMQAAITFLIEAETDHIWLTASPQGAPLYADLGFREVDRIDRWLGCTTGELVSQPTALDITRMSACDAAGWGTPRTALLWEKAQRAEGWHNAGGFMVRHCTESGLQIGPWGGLSAAAAELFAQAVSGTAGKRVFLDVPAANARASELLEGAGFMRRSESLLMCRGVADGYAPENIFALGTMGSIG